MFSIRKEQPGDHLGIYKVNEAAFGRPDEAQLVDKLRKRKDVVLLSLVAIIDERIVGHILFSPVSVWDGFSSWHAIALGPVAVDPAYHHQGIGSELIRAGLEACRDAGHTVVFVLGHATYYPRFGFEKAQLHNLRWEHNAPPEAFMVLPLQPGALTGRRGVVSYLPEFNSV